MGNHQDDELPLLQRLGGASGIRATISGTYQRVLADDKLKPFFEGMSMPALRAHQQRFFTAAFSGMTGSGGGVDLDGASLILERHRHLFEKGGLDETHFDRFLGHIVDALVSQDLPQDAINEAITALKPLRAAFEKGARMYGKAKKEKRMPVHERGSRSSIKGASSVCSKSTKSTMKLSDSRSRGTGSVCSRSSKSTLRQLDATTARERRLAAFLGEDDDEMECPAPPIKIQFKRST